MARIDTLPDFCDGTRTVDQLAMLMDCTRSYMSTLLNRLAKQNIIVLDYSRRPMKPYRSNLRPEYYFKSRLHIPPSTRADRFDNYLNLLIQAANDNERFGRIMELLVNDRPSEASAAVGEIVSELTEDQQAVMLLSIMSQLYGAKNIVDRLTKKSLDPDRAGE